MSLFEEISQKQDNIEAQVTRSIADLQAELAAARAGPQDVNRLDLIEQKILNFQKHIVELNSLVRSQIALLSKSVDRLEMKSRLDCLMFRGCTETDDSTPQQLVEATLRDRFGLMEPNAVDSCYRLGQQAEGLTRVILVRFSSPRVRNLVWRQKTKLRGTSISILEFLTRPRQEAFTMARKEYGIRSCWTRDGDIFIKVPDGSKHMITDTTGLRELVAKHPGAPASLSNSQTQKKEEPKPRPKRTIKSK